MEVEVYCYSEVNIYKLENVQKKFIFYIFYPLLFLAFYLFLIHHKLFISFVGWAYSVVSSVHLVELCDYLG